MQEIQSASDHKTRSIISVISAFFLLASVSVLIKLEVSSASIEWVVFVQMSTCLLVTSIIASRNKFRDLKTNKLKFHLVRGTMGVLAIAFSAIALTKIPLVNAVLLNNSAPLFIPIVTLIWLRTKFDERIWYGILIGFIGIIFILQPNSRDMIKTGDIFGIASGIFLAIAYVALKVLTKTESITTVAFYYSLIGFALSLPFAISNWSNPPLIIWIYGITAGICFIGYMFLLQYAYEYIEAIKLSPFNYLVIVFTGIFDWLIFHHIPDALSFVGIILVSAGGLMAIMLHSSTKY